MRNAMVEGTGTADAVTSNIVNHWTSTTYAPANFFIGTTTTVVVTGSTALTANALATVSLSGVVSGAMNNLHVFFWTDSAQAPNVTLDIGKVQLEVALTATPLAFRSLADELALCQVFSRVYDSSAGASGAASATGRSFIRYIFPAPMRATPFVSFIGSWKFHHTCS